MGCGCVIVTCALTMLRNATSSRAGDLTRSSYVISVILMSNPSTVNSHKCFQLRSQGFQRVTMPRLFPPILTHTGKHTLLRHYLRVSTFHRSIVGGAPDAYSSTVIVRDNARLSLKRQSFKRGNQHLIGSEIGLDPREYRVICEAPKHLSRSTCLFMCILRLAKKISVLWT